MTEAHQEHQEHQEHHLIPYASYFLVWGTLIFLTVVTISVSYLDLKNIAIIAALMIAGVKATLVTLYFMHVRFDKAVVVYMICAFIFTYAVYMGLTMTDYVYR